MHSIKVLSTLYILTQAGKCVGSVDVHGATAADTFSAASAEGQRGVDLVLDSDKGIENHRTGLFEVESVRLHLGLLGRVLGVPPVDLEGLHARVRLGAGDRGHGAGEHGRAHGGRARGGGEEPRGGRAESSHS